MAARHLLLVACLLGASAVLGLRINRDSEDQQDEFEFDEDLLEFHRMFSEGLPAELNATRLRILADIQSGRNSDIPEEEEYDCDALPHMCKAPFHCDQWTHQDTLDIRMHGLATNDNHANLRAWCMPGLEKYAATMVKECVVKKDLKKSAQVSLERTFNDYADELDASICFAEGHCTNGVVTDSTTIEGMEKMCDYRFGDRRGWTRNFVNSLKRLMDMPKSFANLVSLKGGISTQRISRVFSKMSCAMGTFHCDVQYCKHTYCRDAYYVQKYGQLLPSMPGNLMRDPDMTKEVRERLAYQQ